MFAFIESNKTKPEKLHVNPDILADKLLNHSLLKIQNKEYRICEVEFYPHDDPYRHKHVDQNYIGCWYFHRYQNGTYKAGTWKGLDLTLGGQTFLIRSIYHKDTKMIEGPCKVVNHILEMYNCESVQAFVSQSFQETKTSKLGDPVSALENKSNFVICDGIATRDTIEEVHKGVRIGLSAKYPEFRVKEYRYLIGRHLIKRNKLKRASDLRSSL